MFKLTRPLPPKEASLLDAPPQRPTTTQGSCIETTWAQLKDRVAAVWPLEDYVAVNPFMGLASSSFEAAHQQLLQTAHQDILLPWSTYQQAFVNQEFEACDLQAVLAESPGALSLEHVLAYLETDLKPEQASRYQRLSEWMDFKQGTQWESLIEEELSRYCAAHYDQGFASWRSPWADLPLYQAWKAQAKYDRRLEKLGFTRLSHYLNTLPEHPLTAIEAVLKHMRVPEADWQELLYAYLLSMNGWAAWVQYQTQAGKVSESELCGLVAIRLIYEWALWNNSPYTDWPAFQAAVAEHQRLTPPSDQAGLHDRVRYLCQQALEKNYQRHLFAKMGQGKAQAAPVQAQFVFCLDVRSERMRRHLEAASPAVQTFGFAGFFGMSIGYRRLGDQHFVKHCPAPLQVSYCLEEQLCGNTQEQAFAIKRSRLRRALKKTWKEFKSSAISCFSFIETLGLTYSLEFLKETLKLGTEAASQTELEPRLEGADGLSLETQVQLARNMLTQLGLTRDFAPVVLLCGHGSTVRNNPYQAAYDCGACCGHSGAPNALTAAKILNHPQVRQGLLTAGIAIPEQTFFMAALHNTSRDQITFLNRQHLPAGHDLSQLEDWIAQASAHTLAERAAVFQTDAADLLRRSRDWSELRPEWGLAGNASFIIGKRSLSYGADLEGRAFMNHYRSEDDPEGTVLESIMTAPMIVTNWINLQYYASSVSPQVYGSGNKALHNLVGNIGILEGNGGDLKTGLPFQSVHNGERLQYNPLRLSVVIEAPRARIEQIIAKHAGIRDLVDNQWLYIFAYEAGQPFAYRNQSWQAA